jgi:hypothetical protein
MSSKFRAALPESSPATPKITVSDSIPRFPAAKRKIQRTSSR